MNESWTNSSADHGPERQLGIDNHRQPLVLVGRKLSDGDSGMVEKYAIVERISMAFLWISRTFVQLTVMRILALSRVEYDRETICRYANTNNSERVLSTLTFSKTGGSSAVTAACAIKRSKQLEVVLVVGSCMHENILAKKSPSTNRTLVNIFNLRPELQAQYNLPPKKTPSSLAKFKRSPFVARSVTMPSADQ